MFTGCKRPGLQLAENVFNRNREEIQDADIIGRHEGQFTGFKSFPEDVADYFCSADEDLAV